MKVYEVTRTTDGDLMAFVDGEPLRQAGLHNPDGFAFGRGPGADNLAFSVLADYFEEQPTLEDIYEGRCQSMLHFHDFKWAFVTPASGQGGFTLTAGEIAAWLAER